MLLWKKLKLSLKYLCLGSLSDSSGIVIVYLSVFPSLTTRYCIEMTEQIELVFSMEASFHLSHTVL